MPRRTTSRRLSLRLPAASSSSSPASCKPPCRISRRSSVPGPSTTSSSGCLRTSVSENDWQPSPATLGTTCAEFHVKQFDVIVIGAGHAGIEASLAAARMGAETLLLTQNLDHIGQMSCNPAIGGVGKGHLVKEIDALGGEMALAIDATGIQFRTLNTRKGPAVQATRAQADKAAYRSYMKRIVERTAQLSIRQGS